MKISDLNNPEFAAFVQDDTNFGQAGYFEDRAIIKVSLSERITGLLDAFATNSSDLTKEFYGDTWNDRTFRNFGFYDRHTQEIFSRNSHSLSLFYKGEEHFSQYSSTVFDLMTQIDTEVNDKIVEIMKSPEKQTLAIETLKSVNPSYEPNIDFAYLYRLYISGETEPPSSEPSYAFNDKSLLFSYLDDSFRFVQEEAERYISENMVSLGAAVLRDQMEAAEFAKIATSPSQKISILRDIKEAFDTTFPSGLPGNVWVTVARDGREATFQYPASNLVASLDDGSLYESHILPVKTREEIYKEFGLKNHDGNRATRTYSNVGLKVADIVELSYKRKPFYQAAPETRAEKLATRDVEATFFKATNETKEAIQSERYGYSGYRIDGKKAQSGALSPDGFTEGMTATFTVGANCSDKVVCSDILKQVAGTDINTGEPFEELRGRYIGYYDSQRACPGDLLAFDGKVYMLDNYDGIIKMPFELEKDVVLGRDEAMEAPKGISGEIDSVYDAIGSSEIEQVEALHKDFDR